MKKIVIITIICFVLFTGYLPNVIGYYLLNIDFNDEIDQYQTEIEGSSQLCNKYSYAQSFIPTFPILTRIQLHLQKNGTINSDITLSIRSNLYSPDLVTISKSSSQIPTNISEWIEFNFDDISVTPGELYYFIINTTNGDLFDDHYLISCCAQDLYLQGDRWYNSSKYTWMLWITPADFCFKTFGIDIEYDVETRTKWTFMTYDAADSDGTFDPFYHFNALPSSSNLNVTILQDNIVESTKLWHIDRYGHSILMEDMGELNLGDPETLRDYINYCKENFPADRYILDIYSHGGSWHGCCGDTTNNNDFLTLDEMQQALSEAGGVDIITFNAPCLMGNLECVYELRDIVDVYIASEANSGYKLDTTGRLRDLLVYNSTMEPLKIGKTIIEYCKNSDIPYYQSKTFSAIRTDKISGLAQAIDDLSNELIKNSFKSFRNLAISHRNTFEFGAQVYDIFEIIHKFYNMNDTSQNMKGCLKNVLESLNETIIAKFHGPEIHGEGLSIYFPDKISNSSVFTYKHRYTNLDFTEDTHWDEFIILYLLYSVLFSKTL